MLGMPLHREVSAKKLCKSVLHLPDVLATHVAGDIARALCMIHRFE